MRFNKRIESISPFYVMEILEKAKSMEASGHRVIHMEVGEPGFPTTRAVKKEAIRAIHDNRTFYTHSLGLPELREKIADYYFRTDGIRISPERVIITNGTSGALVLLFGVLLGPDTLLAVSDPGYPCYRNIASFVGAATLHVPVSEETGYQLTAEHIAQSNQAPNVVVLANPGNPTGILYEEETLRSLLSHVSSIDGRLIIDEIYSGLVYGRDFHSALALSDEAIVINGFSKTYAMTGFRLGWMVVPSGLVRSIQKCAQNLFISPPSISQYAALRAFDDSIGLQQMLHMYEKRRDYVLSRLAELGFSIPKRPDGAFYIYAGIEKWQMDSMEFVGRALSEAHVAITPGYDFGQYRAGSHVRFSYTENLETLSEGLDMLGSWLRVL